MPRIMTISNPLTRGMLPLFLWSHRVRTGRWPDSVHASSLREIDEVADESVEYLVDPQGGFMMCQRVLGKNVYLTRIVGETASLILSHFE